MFAQYRFFLRLALAVLAALTSAGAVCAAALPDTIDQVRPAIVAVGSYQATRRPPAVFGGTGFVVGDGSLVVTNFHVVPDPIDYTKLERIAVFSGRGKNARVHPVKVVATDELHDLAVLRLDSGKLPALPLGSAAGVREGTEVAFTGFPVGMVLGLHPVTHRGIVSAITPVVIPQTTAKDLSPKMIRAMQDPYDVLQLDATAYPGNSGSPLYDQRSGRVIGVINSVLVKGTKEAALENPTGITYAIPARFVRALLQQVE